MSSLEPLVEALRKRLTRLDERVFGTHADDGTQEQVLEDMGAESIIDAIQQLDDRVAEAEADVQLAKATATTRTTADGGESKKDVALRISRDETVRQALSSKDTVRDAHGQTHELGGGEVSVSDVRTMARPQTELAWKTVHDDAWRKLVQRWPAFTIEDADDAKRLTIHREDVSGELAQLVAESLGQDNLANQVVGGGSSTAEVSRSD